MALPPVENRIDLDLESKHMFIKRTLQLGNRALKERKRMRALERKR